MKRWFNEIVVMVGCLIALGSGSVVHAQGVETYASFDTGAGVIAGGGTAKGFEGQHALELYTEQLITQVSTTIGGGVTAPRLDTIKLRLANTTSAAQFIQQLNAGTALRKVVVSTLRRTASGTPQAVSTTFESVFITSVRTVWSSAAGAPVVEIELSSPQKVTWAAQDAAGKPVTTGYDFAKGQRI